MREESSEQQLQQLVDKKIYTVLDPTLLTYEKDWERFYNSEPIENDNYVFAFNLEKSPLLVRIVNKLAAEDDAIILSYGSTRGFIARDVKDVSGRMGPAEFLNCIKNASHVVTNSYHGCAFSLIFHKDFYCIPHSTRGMRMVDLLTKLQIPDRLIYADDISGLKLLDYEQIEIVRKQYIDSSYEYLSKALFGETRNVNN